MVLKEGEGRERGGRGGGRDQKMIEIIVLAAEITFLAIQGIMWMRAGGEAARGRPLRSSIIFNF
jgi:hypothetical protein